MWFCHNVTNGVMDGHITVYHMTRVTWGPWESKRIATVVKCISSREISENSIEFSLSNSEQRDSWLNSSHWTLDADIKLEKYVWKARKIGFLGIIIGSNGIEIEAEKVDGVLSWLELKNIKDVRKFLGLTNYCRRFIKDFAWVARPMNVLMRKDEKWWWRGQKGLLAWHKLKIRYQVPIACYRVCGDESRMKVLKREYRNLAW